MSPKLQMECLYWQHKRCKYYASPIKRAVYMFVLHSLHVKTSNAQFSKVTASHRINKWICQHCQKNCCFWYWVSCHVCQCCNIIKIRRKKHFIYFNLIIICFLVGICQLPSSNVDVYYLWIQLVLFFANWVTQLVVKIYPNSTITRVNQVTG